MVTSTKLKVLPKGHRIIETAHGNYIQKQKQRRSTYKTPKATRVKMAAAARRIKIPLLTTGVIILPISMATAHAGGLNRVFTANGSKNFFNHLIGSYTGYAPLEENFRFGRLARGLIPLVIVMGVNRLGLFKAANAKLAQMRIPLRVN